MEWAELLTGLIGGGLGGTILGRVWDNRREDRFRHVDVKREVAAKYISLMYELGSTLERLHAAKKARQEEVTDQSLERFDKWHSRAVGLRKQVIVMNGELALLFGNQVNSTAMELNMFNTDLFRDDDNETFPLDEWSAKVVKLVKHMREDLHLRE